MRVLFTGVVSAIAAVATAQNWTTMTLYDVLQEDCRQNISNKDLGDPAGACVRACVQRALSYSSPPLSLHTVVRHSRMLCATLATISRLTCVPVRCR